MSKPIARVFVVGLAAILILCIVPSWYQPASGGEWGHDMYRIGFAPIWNAPSGARLDLSVLGLCIFAIVVACGLAVAARRAFGKS